MERILISLVVSGVASLLKVDGSSLIMDISEII